MELKQEYTYLSDIVIGIINGLIKDLTDFDEDKFLNWLIEKKIETKTNPSAYVRSCFKKELESGRFKVDKKELSDTENICLSMQPFYNAMHDIGIKELGDSTFFAEEANLYILKHKILPIDELRELNHKIVQYMKEMDNPQAEDYCKLFRKSKALRDKVDWEEVDRLADKSKKEWEELMKFFEEREVNPYED